jgi:ATP-dependent Clp protease ATP-binding subunit ClpA
MPSFARELEQTLHNALAEASRRRHEYATLEHLLIALIDDEHASKVMTACGVSRDELRASVKHYLDNELGALVADSGTDPTPTSGFQRVVQRAILHVQSSGRDGLRAPTCSSPCSPSAKVTPSISCSSRT